MYLLAKSLALQELTHRLLQCITPDRACTVCTEVQLSTNVITEITYTEETRQKHFPSLFGVD